jgi:quercetin dioxygenase-like cupin family protein
MTMKRSQARRAQALGTFHGLSVGLVILAGVGLLAARAAEPTDTPTAASRADSSLGKAEVSCVRTYPARYEAGVRTPWHVHDRDQTLTVNDGRAVLQTRDNQVIALEAGESFTVPALDWHWYGAATGEPVSMTVVSACTGDRSGQERGEEGRTEIGISR